MVKKATLDILEIAPKDLDRGTVRDDEEIAEGGGAVEQASGGSFLFKAIGWLRKPLFWITLISVVYLGAVAGILVGFYASDEKIATLQKKQAFPTVSSSKASRGAIFEGIVVDQRDERGNIRIAFCDIAIELNNSNLENAISGDRVDVRNLIYEVLKKEGAQEGLLPEGRNRLKEKLKKELNGLLGENRVTNVYFTSYELD